MKALLATVNHWTSTVRVGSHHLAQGLVRGGWEVAYVSSPVSPLHGLSGGGPELEERRALHRAGGRRFLDGRLWAYVPGALLTPNNKPLLRSAWLHRRWPMFSRPAVGRVVEENGFGDVDLLYLDSALHLPWAKSIRRRRSVFRVTDNNQAFRRAAPAGRLLEDEALRAVDAVVYTADALKVRVEAAGARKHRALPNGVDFAHFADGAPAAPPEYERLPRPIAVYAGSLEEWFDYDLLAQSAAALPDVSFVLIGPEALARRRLPARPNIHVLGRKPYAQLPAFLRHADVGIIPFDVARHGALVHGVNPLKLYEYLASGLPVVATRWEALAALESPALLADGPVDFIARLRQTLAGPRRPEAFRAFARGETWERRVADLLEWLEFPSERSARV